MYNNDPNEVLQSAWNKFRVFLFFFLTDRSDSPATFQNDAIERIETLKVVHCSLFKDFKTILNTRARIESKQWPTHELLIPKNMQGRQNSQAPYNFSSESGLEMTHTRVSGKIQHAMRVGGQYGVYKYVDTLLSRAGTCCVLRRGNFRRKAPRDYMV